MSQKNLHNQFWRPIQVDNHEKIGFLGTVQHFQHLRPSKCRTVPKKPIPEAESAVLSLKNLKNQFWRPIQVDPHEKIGFLGTVQHFQHLRPSKCRTVPKKPIFGRGPVCIGHQNWFFRFFRDSTALSASGIGFLGTVQHFQHLRPSKCRTVPKKPIPEAESAVLSLKNLKNQFWRPIQVDPHEKIGFLGTVQHFQHLRPSKCRTVPKKPIFGRGPVCIGHQNWFFRFFRDSTALSASGIGFLGTVQHFQHLRPSKCRTVPKKPIF